MWTRIGLKANAKKLLMKNYWRIVLVAYQLQLMPNLMITVQVLWKKAWKI